MLMEIKLLVESGATFAWAQVDLDFVSKKWSIQEETNWMRTLITKKGSFLIQPSGAMCLLIAVEGGQTPIIMLNRAPTMDPDPAHTSGVGDFPDPYYAAPQLKNACVVWSVKKLSELRQRILSICKGILPATPDTFLTPGKTPMTLITTQTYATGGVTNCGMFPGWIAKQLGGKSLVPESVQLPKYTMATGQVVTPDPIVVTSPMTAWEEFALNVEAKRGVEKGTLWVPFDPENPHKRPQPGDIYTLAKTPNGKFAHVGIVIDSVGSVWITADSGQGAASTELTDPPIMVEVPDPKDRKKKITIQRVKFSGGMAAGYRRRVFNENGSLTGEFKSLAWLKGWINVDNLYAGWKP